MTVPPLDRHAILEVVHSWPRDEQVSLAMAILEQAGVSVVEEPIAPPDSNALAGLLANGQTPPTDDEVRAWLDQRRMEKYGG